MGLIIIGGVVALIIFAFAAFNFNSECDNLDKEYKDWKNTSDLRWKEINSKIETSMKKLDEHQEWARKERNIIRAELGMPLLEKEINPRSEA